MFSNVIIDGLNEDENRNADDQVEHERLLTEQSQETNGFQTAFLERTKSLPEAVSSLPV